MKRNDNPVRKKALDIAVAFAAPLAIYLVLTMEYNILQKYQGRGFIPSLDITFL